MVLTAGVITTLIDQSGTAQDHYIEEDGDIVVVGFGHPANASNSFTAVRYRDTGELDPTFGDNGVVTTSIGRANDYAQAGAAYSNDEN